MALESDSATPQDRTANRDQPLVELSDLRVCFRTERGVVRAVDGVSLAIQPGETLALVGESGCGKSVTAFSILRLLPTPPAEYAGGQIRFEGRNLLSLSEKEMRSVRGRLISMVFQEPMSSLNPIMTIGGQITETILQHHKLSRREARSKAIEMLKRVGISLPAERFDHYPHQLSGGMRQRAMIAMALVCGPKLLIADEPTTALDVTVQMQILELLRELRQELGMAILLITHDLGIVAELCDRVAVMYAGKIVECAPADELFKRPRHPYTRGLFRSLPALENAAGILYAIPGSVPSPLNFPAGCRFRPRCEYAEEVCQQEPPLRQVESTHLSACHFAERLDG